MGARDLMSPDDRAQEVLAVGSSKLRRGELTRGEFMRLTGAFGVTLAGSGLLSACGSGSTGAGKKKVGELRFLISEAFWANWNPYDSTALISFKIRRNLFDRLVEITPSLELVPGLATKWRQVNARTWEFTLRSGVTFHDGQAMTAEDVKASIELASGASGKKLALAQNIWGVPHEAEVVDELTVRLKSKKPFGPLLNTLAVTDILCAEDIAKGVKHLEAGPPNGTGAYRVTGDEPKRKTLEAFPKHYRGPAGVQKVVWDYIPDGQTRLNALLAGQADLIDRVEPDQLPAIERSEDVQAVSITSLEVQALWFRQDKPPFGDSAALRRAVAWGIDRKAIVDIVGGKTELATSHLPGGVEFHEAQSPQYQFDPERAAAEMKTAGVKAPLSFELIATTGFYPKSKEVCELAVQNLQQAGFDVKLTLLELAAWADRLFSDNPPPCQHGGWGNVTRDPDFALATPFHSPGGGWSGADDPTTDALIDEGKTTTGEARAAKYAELQKRLWSEMPSVPLIYSEITNGLSGQLRGLQLFPTFVHDFWPMKLG